jgi:hypothetical protein
MHAPARAIAFTLWLRHRWALCLVASFLVLAACFSPFLAALDADPRSTRAVNLAIALPCAIAACYLMTVFAYAFDAHLESRGSCFPYRMFTLPVHTAALVLWPMFYGTAVLALCWLAAALWIFPPWGWEPPLVWPALLAAVVLAWTQAVLWCPFGLPWLRVAVALPVLVVPVAGTIAAVLLHAPAEFLYVFLAVQIPAAYVTAYVGLGAARRGDAPRWDWLTSPFAAILPRRSVRDRRFASGYRAQAWWERRHYGMKAPVLVALLLPWSLMGLALPKNPVLTTNKTLAMSLLVPFLVGGMGLDWRGKPNPWAKRSHGLSTFLATRPLSTSAMVAAKLELALWTALAAWAVWLAEVAVALALSGEYREVWGWWRRWNAVAPPWEVAGTALLAATLLVSLTWKNLIAGMCANLTGREGVTRASGMVFAVLIFMGVTVGSLAVDNPRLQEALLRVLPWALGVAVTVKVVLAVWAVQALLRSGLVPVRTVCILMGIWLGVAAGFIVLAIRSVPAEYAGWATLAAGVLLSLPLVRLTASPLALAWDRHR